MPTSKPNDIADIARRAFAFRKQLDRLKRRIRPRDLRWYPYDTLLVFTVLEKLLADDHRNLLAMAGSDPILDVGCGDGDLAFFFESMGCRVDAVDYPVTNFNRMRGVRKLGEALGSSVEIHEADLDGRFSFPQSRYGLAICLGVLYHLKNPFYLLEQLARVSRYCLLSTRVARVAPDRHSSLRDLPVAYLLDDFEANNDPTNFWVFSETGLRRILRRAGWHVLDFITRGGGSASDPASKRGDERAYCLLSSPAFDTEWTVTLLEGWHGLEQRYYRWTGKRFSVRLERRQPLPCSRLSFDFFLPDDHVATLGPVTLGATVNGRALLPQTYRSGGQHCYEQEIPAGPPATTLDIEFVLDRSMAPSSGEKRELGLVVSFAREGCAISEANLPLRLR